MTPAIKTALIPFALMAAGLLATAQPAHAQPAAVETPAYFTETPALRMTRGADGILLVEFNSHGGPLTFSAAAHEGLVDTFYKIGRDRGNKVVIFTGAGGEWIPEVDFASFGDVSDPDVWSNVHDEGVQVLENLVNIRVPVICAVEGKAWVHTEYCLTANVIVAGQGATFNDAPHYAGGIVPGDGVYTAWSHWAGPGRAQAFLLDPKPISAETAREWGVVAEVTPQGGAVARARALATQYLEQPELTRRYTRTLFVQPLKERIVRETGYALLLEGESADALVKASKAAAR